MNLVTEDHIVALRIDYFNHIVSELGPAAVLGMGGRLRVNDSKNIVQKQHALSCPS